MLSEKTTKGLILLSLGLLHICLGGASGGKTDQTSAIVSEWPVDMIVREGDPKRIPFTFYPNATFVVATMRALFHGESSPKTIYQATEASSGIQPGFENDFEVIPEHKHDLRIKQMDPKLSGDYLASVTHPDLEEETRQFLVTAIESPQCSYNSAADYIVEGEKISLYCSVKYVGSLVPVIKWYDYKGRELDGEYVDPSISQVAKQRIYRHSFTAGIAHDDRQFLCRISSAEDPDYSDECTTSFLVLSRTSDCSARRSHVKLHSLNVIECSTIYAASRRPMITWYDANLNKLEGTFSEKEIPPVGERPPLKELSNVVVSWDFTAEEYFCVVNFPEGLTNTCNVTTNVQKTCMCYGYTSDLTCTGSSVINLLGVTSYYSGSSCSSCPSSRSYCSDSLALYWPSKLEEFKGMCDGQQTCKPYSSTGRIPNCSGGQANFHEHFYLCEDLV